ncbi:hypothetical protein [Virgibacillus oceani]|uniref:Uncharacterized protein n=1 Tax=Virgibacillus oceani TaxID=1479511 RepID=A0A917M3X8_9BACI|nr:hypothetical protein [Virgibacillus oceani]GGG75447.1 hypothetical protein GCM10011398_20340 [Virgibacillus oceani]
MVVENIITAEAEAAVDANTTIHTVEAIVISEKVIEAAVNCLQFERTSMFRMFFP